LTREKQIVKRSKKYISSIFHLSFPGCTTINGALQTAADLKSVYRRTSFTKIIEITNVGFVQIVREGRG